MQRFITVKLQVRGNKFRCIFPDLVAYKPELVHDLFFRSCGFGRVRKIVVKQLGGGWKIRASLPGRITNRNDEIKINIPVFIHMVRTVAGYIQAILFHDGNSTGVHAVGFHTSAIHLCPVTGKILKVSVRNLTAAAVAGTENKNFLHAKFIFLTKTRAVAGQTWLNSVEAFTSGGTSSRAISW